MPPLVSKMWMAPVGNSEKIFPPQLRYIGQCLSHLSYINYQNSLCMCGISKVNYININNEHNKEQWNERNGSRKFMAKTILMKQSE